MREWDLDTNANLLHCPINNFELLKCSLEIVYAKLYTLDYNVGQFSRNINKSDFNYKERCFLYSAMPECFRWIKVKDVRIPWECTCRPPITGSLCNWLHAMPPTSCSQPVTDRASLLKQSHFWKTRDSSDRLFWLEYSGWFCWNFLRLHSSPQCSYNRLFFSPSIGSDLHFVLPAFSSPLLIFYHIDTSLNKILAYLILSWHLPFRKPGLPNHNILWRNITHEFLD